MDLTCNYTRSLLEQPQKQKITDAYEIGRHGNNKYRFLYDSPVRFNQSRYHSKVDSVHLVAKIFKTSSGYYCYSLKSNSRRGWEIPLEGLVSVDVIKGKEDAFNSLEEFAKRFDKRFITDAGIKDLWESNSGQHGGKYRPSDFRRVSKVMKRKVKQFVEVVKDIRTLQNIETPPQGFVHFCDSQYHYYSVEHYTDRHSGRDIAIEYYLGKPYVHYKSEFQGCGNGSYGLLATENTWLHLEDD